MKEQNYTNTIALHEIGHFMANYGLGLYHEFNFTSIVPRDGGLGWTETYDARSAFDTPDAHAHIERALRGDKEAQAAMFKVMLPLACFLYGGGSILRYRGEDRSYLNTIDHNTLAEYLSQRTGVAVNLMDISRLQPIVDRFLHQMFEAYSDLIVKAYDKLVEMKTIKEGDMDQLLTSWGYEAPKEDFDQTLATAGVKLKENLKEPYQQLCKEYKEWYEGLMG